MDRKWIRTFALGVVALVVAALTGILAPPAYALTTVTGLSFSANPFTAGTASTYTFGFRTSATGALTAGTGTITLTDTGGALPTTAGNYAVDAAGHSSPATVAVGGGGSTITITTPVNVANSTIVSVTITGVTTPVAGSYTAGVSTSADGTPDTTTYSIGQTPTQLVITSGNNQSASTGTLFTAHLGATLKDASNATVNEAGIPVTFTVVPAVNGAGATFLSVGGPTFAVATTDNHGLATADPLFANGIAGSYTITASATIGATVITMTTPFNATNTAGAPLAPTGVTATGGNASATVSWTAPANGGSPITGYTVTSSPGGISATTTGTSVVVPGLSNGTGYTFTVTATNGVGTSPASAPSNAVVPQIPSNNGTLAPPVVGIASLPNGTGYWLADAAGGVSAHGTAVNYGSMAGQHLNAPITHIVATPTGLGYWLVAADGGTFTFGDAGFYGSMGNQHLNAPVVDIAPTPSGHGYWLVASDGGIFTFGDAVFHGSMGGQHLNKPVVGMAAGPGGYWEVATDGGIFSFGVPFYGSEGGSHLNKPINGMSVSSDGLGYWFVASDGGIFSFGDAGFHGSTGGQTLNAPIVGMTAAGPGGGYWLAASDGGVFSFNAPFYGAD